MINAKTFQVSIFGTRATGIDMGEEIARYFSFHMGIALRLLYIGGSGQREIPGAAYMPKHFRALSISVNDKLQPQRLRFADAAPLLITSTASEEDARRRLPPVAQGEDVIIRFRPNVHVDVDGEQQAYDEDGWSMLSIRSQTDREQEVTVRCLATTVRCLSLNVDLAKGGMIATNKQLYGLLAKDRRVNDKFPSKHIRTHAPSNDTRLTFLARQASLWPIRMCRTIWRRAPRRRRRRGHGTDQSLEHTDVPESDHTERACHAHYAGAATARLNTRIE